MKRTILAIFLATIFSASCSEDDGQYALYYREFVGETEVGGSVTKQIVFRNPSVDSVQHLVGLNFDAGQNTDGNFQVEKVEIGGVAVNPRDKDISVPPGSILQVYIKYRPLNLNTTVANFGGWRTGEVERYEPREPGKAESADKTMEKLLGKKEPDLSYDKDSAIHRAIFAAVYDYPTVGVVQIELVGKAHVGPNGERSAGGGGSGECPDGSGVLCYKGGFAMELPDIMNTGPSPLTITGPIAFNISGTSVNLDMTTFPSALLVLKGNGPGEPLEGKPINAISLVISGPEGVTASGTFDGTNLDVNGVAFRIRVVLGEISEKDITPGLQAAVDFVIKDLQLKTKKPYTNGSITLGIETTLGKEPSGNPMFDQMLGGLKVNVVMDGELIVQ